MAFALYERKLWSVAETIANDLRVFRKRLRLTQQEMASRIGASRGQYANWEVGTANPPLEYLRRLKAMGFVEAGDSIPPEHSGTTTVRATPGQFRVLIEVLYDSSIAEPIRTNAKQELLAALGIPDDNF